MLKKEKSKIIFINSIAFILVICILITLVFKYDTFAAENVIGNDYPYRNDTYLNSKGYHVADRWGFFKRECVSFAAWCLNSRNGISFTNYYSGKKFGNASRWGTVAGELGIPVDGNPAVGSIAWRKKGNHVAWVAKVDGNNVTVEEYEGCGGDHGYHTRTMKKSYYDGFIHFKDLSSVSEEPPVIQDVQVNEKTRKGYKISCVVKGSNVTAVRFPSWTVKNDQDDLGSWPHGYYENGRWYCWIDASLHNFEEGEYVTDIYAEYPGGSVNYPKRTSVFIDRTAPEITDIKVENKDINGYDISCIVTDNHSSISSVRVATWTPWNGGGQDDLKWGDAHYSGSRWRYHVNTSDHNNETGTYISDIYAYDEYGNTTDTQDSHFDIIIDKPSTSNKNEGTNSYREDDSDNTTRTSESDNLTKESFQSEKTDNNNENTNRNSMEDGESHYNGYYICPEAIEIPENRRSNNNHTNYEIHYSDNGDSWICPEAVEAPEENDHDRVSQTENDKTLEISDVRCNGINADGYEISCKVTGDTDIKYVQFITTAPDGNVLMGYGDKENGRYHIIVDTTVVDNIGGIYSNYIVAEDEEGNMQSASAQNVELP